MRSVTVNEVCPSERRIRASSDKLLSSLKEHHDYSIPAPERPVPAPKPVLVTDEWVERQKAKPHWFAVVEDLGPVNPRAPLVDEIVSACGRYFNVPKLELLSSRRHGPTVYARQMAMYLAKTLTDRSYPDIGRRLGKRDHTTVMHGIRKVKNLALKDWRVAFDVAHLEAML